MQEIKEIINSAKAIFFDLDGTLIDTEPLYNRFWCEACLYYGFNMSREQALFLRSLDAKLAESYLNDISGNIIDYQLAKAKRSELMDEYLKTHPIELKSGARELLEYLVSINKPLYIVSANVVEKSRRIMRSLDIEKYFTDVLSAKDVKRGKPFKDVYEYACQKINLNPRDVVVFEDSPNGVKSAYDAGCIIIMVDDLTSKTDDMDYVKYEIKSLLETI